MPPSSRAAPTARLCNRPSRPASAAKQRAPWANPDPATLLGLCQQVPHEAPFIYHTWSSQGTSPLFGELCTCICSHVAGGKTEKSLTTHELRWFPPQPPTPDRSTISLCRDCLLFLCFFYKSLPPRNDNCMSPKQSLLSGLGVNSGTGGANQTLVLV